LKRAAERIRAGKKRRKGNSLRASEKVCRRANDSITRIAVAP
jgi:hypothetical protein